MTDMYCQHLLQKLCSEIPLAYFIFIWLIHKFLAGKKYLKTGKKDTGCGLYQCPGFDTIRQLHKTSSLGELGERHMRLLCIIFFL